MSIPVTQKIYLGIRIVYKKLIFITDNEHITFFYTRNRNMMKILLGFMSISFAHNTMAMDYNGAGIGMSNDEFTALKQEIKEAVDEGDYGFAHKKSETVLQTHEGLTDTQQMELAEIMSNAYTLKQQHMGMQKHEDMQHHGVVMSDSDFHTLVQNLNHGLEQKQYDHVSNTANEALHNHQNPLTEEQQLTLVSIISQATEAVEKAERDIIHGQHQHHQDQDYVYNPEDFRDRDTVKKMEHNQSIRDKFNPGDHNANQSSVFNPNEGKKVQDRMDPELRSKLDARRLKDQ